MRMKEGESAHQVSTIDWFGYSVAVAGDTVVVGAINEDGSATGVNGPVNEGRLDAGAAYIFTGFVTGSEPRPSLAIGNSTGPVRVSWPRPATGFVLEKTATLTGAPIPWMPVAFPYQTNATEIFITVPLPTSNNFYRLRQP
jgi:hypothetical protein